MKGGFKLSTLLAGGVLTIAPGLVQGQSLPVCELLGDTTDSACANIRTYGAKVEGVVQTDEGPGLCLKIGTAGTVQRVNPVEQDLSAYDGIYYRVRGTGPLPSRVGIWIQSVPTVANRTGSFYTIFELVPGQERTYVCWFTRTNAPLGLHFDRAQDFNKPFMSQWGSNDAFNPSRVRGWYVYTEQGAQMNLEALRLVKRRKDYTGLIDTFGQMSGIDFPGKVTDESELTQRAVEERAELDGNAPIAEMTGSNKLKAGVATGRWRVERNQSGNWYIVHPNGRRFWSLGVNGVNTDMATRVEGREQLYQDLPAAEDPHAAYFNRRPTPEGTKRSFNFYRRNLHRKFGPNWQETWQKNSLDRMAAWGFNTVGGFSEGSVFARGVPYTEVFTTNGFPVRLATPYTFWGYLPDPFAPNFSSYCVQSFRKGMAPHIRQRDFMGVFVDNELSWGVRGNAVQSVQVATASLNAPTSQPAKKALIALLVRKYRTIGALNAAWGTKYASWNTLHAQNGYGNPTITSNMNADLKWLVLTYAERYYSTVQAALKKAGFTGLYLGSRELSSTPEEVLQASVKYVDIVSMNLYGDDNATWNLAASLKRPVLVSEFTYGSVTRGFHNPNLALATANDEERARCLQNYLRRALATKNFVGVHWFSYADDQVNGRVSDDERWNSGFVDVTDTPHYTLVNALRETAGDMYSIRG